MSRCRRRAFLSLCALVLAFGAFVPRPAGAAIQFSAAETVPISAKPDYLATADLNRDGRADVVSISNASNEMDVFLGSSTSTSRLNPATAVTFGKDLRQHALGDLNADNNIDVVVPDHGAKGVWILIGRGDGTFLPPYIVQVGRNPVSVAIANFDGVRNADLAIADEQQDRVFVRLNDGQTPPQFPNGPDFQIGDKPAVLIADDFNNDDNPDIVSLNLGGPRGKDVGILIFDRIAANFPVFRAVQNFVVGEKPEAMASGDFNNDEVPDLALLNKPRTTGNDFLDVLLANGDGGFNVPSSTEIPCPFFTGGLFCDAKGIAVADFDGNANVDLAVIMSDPRRFSTTDALQVFAGRGEGGFVAATVISVGKAPTTIAAGDVNGDGPLDVVVTTRRVLTLQAFINVSTPGTLGNGEECVLGDECASGRCTNGFCCATQCFDFERCDVPEMQGICLPVIDPVDCSIDADCFGVCADDPRTECTEGTAELDCGDGVRCLLRKCQDDFCCDVRCSATDDRCNVPDFEGICIPKLEEGGPCLEDEQCLSGFCRDDFCCNQDCANGACNVEDLEGLCQPRLPLGEDCTDDQGEPDDDLCGSGVCDPFDLICCNDVCSEEEFCDEDGFCTPFPTPTPTQDPNFTPGVVPTGQPTPTPTQTKAPAGSLCDDPSDCNTPFCVNGVCCLVDEGDGVGECNLSTMHCQEGTGNCVTGTPAPTRTRTVTVRPSFTPTVNPGACDPSCPPANCAPDGTCILSSRSGGCSTTEGASGTQALGLALLPAALWLVRRRRAEQLARIRVRRVGRVGRAGIDRQ